MPLSPDERRVSDLLAPRLKEMYETLAAHVAIPTGRDHEAGLDVYGRDLINRFERLGASVSKRSGNPRPWWMRNMGLRPTLGQRAGSGDVIHSMVIARRHVRVDRPRILIVGHMDTVHDPRGEFRELKRSADGVHATGPGAVDMKGGIVCALYALEALQHAGVEVNWTFALNADEETGSFQSEAALHDLATEHDFGIVTEPALPGGALAIERMGSGQFMIEVHGVAAHAGREFEKGRSAVTRLGQVLVALGEMADPAAGMIVNVGPILGGEATNIVPDYAACWGNVRYDSPQAGARLAEMIDALATLEPSHSGRGQSEGRSDSKKPSAPASLPAGEGSEDCRVVVHRHWNRPAKPLTPEVERFARIARGAAEDLGQSLPFSKTGGVCDGNILQSAGLPTLDTLGIRGGNLHRTDEFIEIPSLVERGQLLALVMMRLTTSGPAD